MNWKNVLIACAVIVCVVGLAVFASSFPGVVLRQARSEPTSRPL